MARVLRSVDPGINAKPVKLETAQFIGELRVIRDDDTAFSAGNVLNGVEGENRGAPGANVATFVAGSCRVRRVFNHRNAITLAKSVNSVQIGGRASVVDGDNCFGLWRNRGFNMFRRDHQRIAIDIDHDGVRAE